MPRTSRRSLWNDTLPASERFEPSSPGSVDRRLAGHDVAIVGGGYTGLWTAWYLVQRDPSLRIVVLERDRVGFGASGRNGGWCSAILPMSLDTIAARHGTSAAHRMQVAMHDTVREVGRFASEHTSDGVFHRGGTIDLARNEPQRRRLLEHLDEQRRFGFSDDDQRWLDAAETAEVVRAEGAIGAVTTPHCGTVHPLRLVHALARAVEAAGVTIAEGVEVHAIHAGRLETSIGEVRAEVVVRATEGYTCDLPGERRSMLPIYSLTAAT